MSYIILLLIFSLFCGVGAFIFLKLILPTINGDRELEQKENLLLFKVLYNEDIYSIWNSNTESFLILKTILDEKEIEFIGLFENPQSVYSLFDRSTNPWKSSYKIIKISRNKLLSEKIYNLEIDTININGRMYMEVEKFEKIERNFYKSIIEGRISSGGITIGEDIYNAIEGDYFYIECE